MNFQCIGIQSLMWANFLAGIFRITLASGWIDIPQAAFIDLGKPA